MTAAIMEAAVVEAEKKITAQDIIHEVGNLGSLETKSGMEETAEVREAIISERGLTEQIDLIKRDSKDALVARNEAKLNEQRETIKKNREAGRLREEKVHGELLEECLSKDGSHVEKQPYLRDEKGEIVKDPQTGEGCRLDFAFIKDGRVKRLIDVTSETADKTAQLEKARRIREVGGNYIRDCRTGELVPIPPDVKPEVVRMP